MVFHVDFLLLLIYIIYYEEFSVLNLQFSMKKKRGEIATLLTLGLVIIGGLITLGTSLFISNQKNNLASNSRAREPLEYCSYTSKSVCEGKCGGTGTCDQKCT